jgi:hypothetical protein
MSQNLSTEERPVSQSQTFTVPTTVAGTLSLTAGFTQGGVPVNRKNEGPTDPTPVVINASGAVVSDPSCTIGPDVSTDVANASIEASSSCAAGTYYVGLQQGGLIDPNGGWLAVTVTEPGEDDTWGSLSGLPAPTPDA